MFLTNDRFHDKNGKLLVCGQKVLARGRTATVKYTRWGYPDQKLLPLCMVDYDEKIDGKLHGEEISTDCIEIID